jgi:hypothetical protein
MEACDRHRWRRLGVGGPGPALVSQAHDAQLMLSSRRSIDAAAIRRGIDCARERNARIVGGWLSTDTDATTLEEVGFERGWEPWWMTAPMDAITEPDDPRAVLSADVPEYGPGGSACSRSPAASDHLPGARWRGSTGASQDGRGALLAATSLVSMTSKCGRSSGGAGLGERSCVLFVVPRGRRARLGSFSTRPV